MAKPALSVMELSCVRAGRPLFQGMSWSASLGSILHVSGANGAGKSSLLAIMAGFLRPSSGRLLWQGDDLSRAVTPTYLGHSLGLTGIWTVYQNLVLTATLLGRVDVDFDAVLDDLGLCDYRDRLVQDLSRGLKQRVALARFVLTDSPLWLMDEPGTGLDKDSLLWLSNRLEQHVGLGGIAVMTSHQSLGIDNMKLIDLECWAKHAGLEDGLWW
jgi:heme exporter protein A